MPTVPTRNGPHRGWYLPGSASGTIEAPGNPYARLSQSLINAVSSSAAVRRHVASGQRPEFWAALRVGSPEEALWWAELADLAAMDNRAVIEASAELWCAGLECRYTSGGTSVMYVGLRDRPWHPRNRFDPSNVAAEWDLRAMAWSPAVLTTGNGSPWEWTWDSHSRTLEAHLSAAWELAERGSDAVMVPPPAGHEGDEEAASRRAALCRSLSDRAADADKVWSELLQHPTVLEKVRLSERVGSWSHADVSQLEDWMREAVRLANELRQKVLVLTSGTSHGPVVDWTAEVLVNHVRSALVTIQIEFSMRSQSALRAGDSLFLSGTDDSPAATACQQLLKALGLYPAPPSTAEGVALLCSRLEKFVRDIRTAFS